MTEARNCEKCGAELGAEASFCTSCGAPVEPAELTSTSERKVSDMVKWEYKSVTTEIVGAYPMRMRDLDPDYNESTADWFNKLGNDGWELVNIIPMYIQKVRLGKQSGIAYLVFKRPLS